MTDLNPIDTQVWETYRIAPGQVYIDNDKRNATLRRVKVLSVASKPDKAACSTCSSDGRCLSRTLWISFKRLSDKRLYTLVQS